MHLSGGGHGRVSAHDLPVLAGHGTRSRLLELVHRAGEAVEHDWQAWRVHPAREGR